MAFPGQGRAAARRPVSAALPPTTDSSFLNPSRVAAQWPAAADDDPPNFSPSSAEKSSKARRFSSAFAVAAPVEVNFQDCFQEFASKSGAGLDCTSPSIEWGGFGATLPSLCPGLGLGLDLNPKPVPAFSFRDHFAGTTVSLSHIPWSPDEQAALPQVTRPLRLMKAAAWFLGRRWPAAGRQRLLQQPLPPLDCLRDGCLARVPAREMFGCVATACRRMASAPGDGTTWRLAGWMMECVSGGRVRRACSLNLRAPTSRRPLTSPPHLLQRHKGFIYASAHVRDVDGRTFINDGIIPVDIDAGFEVAPGDASDVEVTNVHVWGSVALLFSDGAVAWTAPHIAQTPSDWGIARSFCSWSIIS